MSPTKRGRFCGLVPVKPEFRQGENILLKKSHKLIEQNLRVVLLSLSKNPFPSWHRGREGSALWELEILVKERKNYKRIREQEREDWVHRAR